jgi:hypothetical protein
MALHTKLKKFQRKYPSYNSDQILAATIAYVESYEASNYSFMKTAEYFIWKDDTSTLATWIDNADAGEEVVKEASTPRGDIV